MADPAMLPRGEKSPTPDVLANAVELPGRAESVAAARVFVRETLGERHPAVDDVTLLVSELVTNGVVHSKSRDGGTVTVMIVDRVGHVHIEVTDEGGETAPEIRDNPLGEGGRGLLLVELIAHRWGFSRDWSWQSVWCEVRYGSPARDVVLPGDSAAVRPAEPHSRSG
ncbi:ATP-binding protein [Sphaerisporangium sp. B11E5]|uniref:ATP-binding protein n=1 Tax=Sphaerisporangium sp. B11E5 TaxID=3153563 RepID=UPI00325F3CB0